MLLQKIKEIMEAVTIPVMAKVRIGHFAEAQILEALGIDFIDESEGWWTKNPLLTDPSGMWWFDGFTVYFSMQY